MNEKVRSYHLDRPRCLKLVLFMRMVDVFYPYEEMELIRLVKKFTTDDGVVIWKVEVKSKGPEKFKHSTYFKTYTETFIIENFRLMKEELIKYRDLLERPL